VIGGHLARGAREGGTAAGQESFDTSGESAVLARSRTWTWHKYDRKGGCSDSASLRPGTWMG